MTLLDVTIASLTTVAILSIAGWVGQMLGRRQVRREYAQRCEETISRFTEQLSNEIRDASQAEDSQELHKRAKMIVSIRNQMKGMLGQIAEPK